MAGTFGLTGKVFLVGAGPGAADLLTVRALEVLRRAEIVLHDELVSEEVLNLLPTSCQVLNVGKRCGKQVVKQEEIHARMIRFARQGRTVVRLKGGDPLVFARAQEEMQALRQAGVLFEIIPGVTAALAAAAAAQIPLTARQGASKLLFVSNHQSEDKQTRHRRTEIASDTTLVFYMPGRDFAELVQDLRETGVAQDTACLIVSNASRPEQKLLRATLNELSNAHALPAPSLLIVGSMVQEFADGRPQEDFEALDIQLEEVLALGEIAHRETRQQGLQVRTTNADEEDFHGFLPHSLQHNYG